jgi:hypothetical protein
VHPYSRVPEGPAEEVIPLFLAAWFARLEELWWFNVPIPPRAIATLAEKTNFSNLRVLVLSDAGLTSEGLEALAQAPWVAGLETFSLGKHGLGSGLIALSKVPFRQLKKLDLSREDVTTEIVEVLLDSLSGRYLEELNLDYNPGIDDGVIEVFLRHRKSLAELRSLRLSGTSITAEGWSILCQEEAFEDVSLLSSHGSRRPVDRT